MHPHKSNGPYRCQCGEGLTADSNICSDANECHGSSQPIRYDVLTPKCNYEHKWIKGKFTQNDNFISCSVRGAESNGEGPRYMR